MANRLETLIWILIFITILISGCTVEQNPRRVNIDSHNLSMFSAGAGTPAVVIDVGFGETYNSWMMIIDSISAYTRVIAYDRAGYGQSEPGPFPRNCQQEAAELNSMLERAQIEPPYILVGHSLGGLNAQYFAYRFPGVVGGIILLDPPPLRWISGKADFPRLDSLADEQTQYFLSMVELAGTSLNPEDETKIAYFETLASEHEEMFKSSADQILSIGSFSDLPVTVIASGKINPRFGEDAERFQKFWIAESKSITLRSTRGKFLLLEESTHQIHKDFPLRIISEIKDILASLQKTNDY